MARQRTLRLSLVGGIISPDCWGRVDVSAIQQGVADAVNMIIRPQGSAVSRQGTKFVARCASNTPGASRLLQFSFSTTQNFAIEFTGGTGGGNGSFGFFAQGAQLMNGGTQYTVTHSYQQSDIAALNYVESGDVITLVHTSYPPKELIRYGNLDWRLSAISFASKFTPPASVTAVATAPSAAYSQTFTYIVTVVDQTGNQESLASATSNSVSNDLTVSGDYNTITWPAATPPSGGTIGAYNIYKSTNGGAFGYIGQTNATTLTFIDNNITADYTQTPPLNDNVFGSAGNYPGAVAYFQQRRWLAGTNNTPNGIWATQSGTGSNMNYTIPAQDNNRISVNIAAQRANRIEHLVPISNLFAFSSSTDWMISGGSATAAITATTFTVVPQSQNGAGSVHPIVVDNYILYPAYQGGHIFGLAWDWESQTFPSVDVCLLANHLFDGHIITDAAFCRYPMPILWAVNDAGELLGLTYARQQQISAWHRHDVGGFVESVVSITENNADVLYMIVRRTINGAVVRYIETLSYVAGGMNFVDCGAELNNLTPSATVSGLTWLEGQYVSVLADGVVMTPRLVTGGTITLDFAASNVHVGLGFNADTFTLPVMIQGAPDMGQSMISSVNEAYIRVKDSGLFQVGPDENNLMWINSAVFPDPINNPSLASGVLRLDTVPNWDESGQILIRQSQPLPLEIIDITLEVALSG